MIPWVRGEPFPRRGHWSSCGVKLKVMVIVPEIKDGEDCGKEYKYSVGVHIVRSNCLLLLFSTFILVLMALINFMWMPQVNSCDLTLL